MADKINLKEQPVYICDNKRTETGTTMVTYDKYFEVVHERDVLKEIIVELNKKIIELEHKLKRK